MPAESIDVEKAARPVPNPTGAAARVSSKRVCAGRPTKSRAKALRQAADILWLLTFCPRNSAEQMGFAVRLRRSLQRAYAERGKNERSCLTESLSGTKECRDGWTVPKMNTTNAEMKE